jgi:trehalose 6-phosphate synthase
MRACSGTWIAHGSGTADARRWTRTTACGAAGATRIHAPARVADTEEEERATTTASPTRAVAAVPHRARAADLPRVGLGALRHGQPTFAEAVRWTRRRPRAIPFVLVQDYHFALLPRMIREIGCRTPPSSPSGTSRGPTRRRSASARGARRCSTACSAAASSAFTRSSTATTSSTPSTASGSARRPRDVHGLVRRRSDTPCGATRSRSSGRRRELVASAGPSRVPRRGRERHGLPPEHKLGVGVDRLDYTKGILERFRAIERLLELKPEWIGASPSCRSPRRRARGSSATRPRGKVRSPGRAHQRALRRRPAARSCSSRSTTSRTACTSSTAPPTCASSAACTTA